MPKIKIVIIALVLWVQLFSILTAQEIDNAIEIDRKTELHKLPNDIIPEHYHVELNLDTIEERYFKGTCYIFLRIDGQTEKISFHAKLSYVHIEPSSIEIQLKDSLSLNIMTGNKYIDNKKEYYKPDKCIYYVKSQVLKLQNFLPNISSVRGIGLGQHTLHWFRTFIKTHTFQKGQNYILKVPFKTTLYDNEDLFKTYINKGDQTWLVNTPTFGIRRIFPCWDEPTFKATFKLSIKHLAEHTVLSNMPGIQINKQLPRGLSKTVFKETPRISPSSIMIVVSDFPYILSERINLRYRQRVALSLKYAETVIKNVTLHMESQWSNCKELVKVNHVAIPGFDQESMNKWGFVFYRETALIYDEKLDPIMRKINVIRLVASAVARQCFDNVIGSSSWSHTLTEILFKLLETNVINQIYPDFRILDLFVVQTQQESLRLDTHSIMMPLISEAKNTEINPFFYHMKMPAILRMLQHVLSDEACSNVIEILFKKERKDLNFDNLWDMLLASNKLYNNSYTLDIRDMMNPWIRLNHYPMLKVTQHDLFHIKISIKNALDQMVGIPVTFTTEKYSNFNNTYPYYNMWLTRPDMNIYSSSVLFRLNLSSWIIINTQQTGYYRVNYDVACWERIIRYLTSEKYTKIHVLNRAQIIDDAFYFMMNDQLSLSTFLKLTQHLQRETDYIAWYPMIKALEHISGFFLFQEGAHVKEYMRDTLHKLLKIITYTEKSDEKPNDLIKCLRQEAAKWACVLGDSTCYDVATSKLMLYFNDKRLLPGWKKWTYCNGVHDPDTWLKVFDTWVNRTDNKLLEYLTCSESTYAIRRFLNMIYMKNVSMQSIDRINSFFFVVTKHAKDDIILQYMLYNFKELKPREVSWYVILIITINHVQSEDQLNKVFDFVKDYKKRIGEAFNFKFNFDDQHKLNRKTYEAVKILNQMDYVPIMIVKQKIDLRSSEIENQLNNYYNLLRY